MPPKRPIRRGSEGIKRRTRSSTRAVADSTINSSLNSPKKGKATRATRKVRNWASEPSEIFDVDDCPRKSRDAALARLAEIGGWGQYYSNYCRTGMKVYYRCKAMPLRGVQCDAGLYLEYPSHNTTVQMFVSTDAHNHDVLPGRTRLTADIKKQIQEQFNRDDNFLLLWREFKGVLKDKSQLHNLLARFRKDKRNQIEP